MEITPARTRTMTTTGTSKVTPNAKNVVSAKERYLSISVIHATPSGAIDAMNLNTTGNTRKYANDIPTMNSTELATRSEEHTSELQSQSNLVCRLLLEKKKKKKNRNN